MIPAVWAHRGATDGARENTVAAFERARHLGAQGVELDVRRSADGVLVVHHDPVVPGVGLVADTPAGQLPDHVPTLAAALSACDGLRVNVEIKDAPQEPGYRADPALAGDTAEAIDRAGLRGDQVIVSSFSSPVLEATRRAAPRLAVGWLLGVFADVGQSAALAARRHFDAVHPFVSGLQEPAVRQAHALGLAVHVWTVNAEEDLRRMAELEVEAVITDQVALALRLLGVGPP